MRWARRSSGFGRRSPRATTRNRAGPVLRAVRGVWLEGGRAGGAPVCSPDPGSSPSSALGTCPAWAENQLKWRSFDRKAPGAIASGVGTESVHPVECFGRLFQGSQDVRLNSPRREIQVLALSSLRPCLRGATRMPTCRALFRWTTRRSSDHAGKLLLMSPHENSMAKGNLGSRRPRPRWLGTGPACRILDLAGPIPRSV